MNRGVKWTFGWRYSTWLRNRDSWMVRRSVTGRCISTVMLPTDMSHDAFFHVHRLYCCCRCCFHGGSSCCVCMGSWCPVKTKIRHVCRSVLWCVDGFALMSWQSFYSVPSEVDDSELSNCTSVLWPFLLSSAIIWLVREGISWEQ